MNFSDIEKIKRFCVDLCRIIEDLSNLYFFNMAEELELSTSKKYSLLYKAFLYLYQKSEKEFNNNLAKEILNTIPKKQKAVFGNCYIRSYVHVIISYELSQCSEKIEQERADKNIERKVKLLSPSTFLYMRYRMGNNADSLKRTYRWLFIKVWLYAYLKDKDLLAKKVGEIIADDDRFYYLKEKVSKNNPDSDVFSSRVETLTKEFSRWKKHIRNNQYETGYLAGFLENKCHRHYWL
ncbi:hypothetical protein [Photobacterium leiognathi]|uniref:hypothetical protein n=1 Tax=Photobacterium leiognathi TaxID=553611 RepID=UPI00298271E5|nr:hypothetical protein [Photobacterium leiognathi]